MHCAEAERGACLIFRVNRGETINGRTACFNVNASRLEAMTVICKGGEKWLDLRSQSYLRGG